MLVLELGRIQRREDSSFLIFQYDVLSASKVFFKYPAVKGPERQLGSYAVVNIACVLGHKFECLKG